MLRAGTQRDVNCVLLKQNPNRSKPESNLQMRVNIYLQAVSQHTLSKWTF